MNTDARSQSDTFWRSKAAQSGISWFLTVTLGSLIAAFGWSLTKTSELESDVKLYKSKVDDLRGDVQEIKVDVKTLLRKNP